MLKPVRSVETAELLPSINPISHGGVLKTCSDFEANFRPLLLKIDAFTLYDFYYMGFRQPMVKKKLNFLGGTPRSGPLKILKLQNFQKSDPHDLL